MSRQRIEFAEADFNNRDDRSMKMSEIDQGRRTTGVRSYGSAQKNSGGVGVEFDDAVTEHPRTYGNGFYDARGSVRNLKQ